MKIKRTVSTYLQKQNGKLDEFAIRTSVRWKEDDKQQTIAYSVGYTITKDKWNSSESRVKRRAVNRKLISAVEINKEIERFEHYIDTAFQRWELDELLPPKTKIKEAIDVALGKTTYKRSKVYSVQEAYQKFILDLSNKKSLEVATYNKHKTVRNSLKDFDCELTLQQVTAGKLSDYVDYLVEEKGLANTTIKKRMQFINQFLHFCDINRLIDTDWKTYQCNLKVVTGKQIIFLTKEEVKRIIDLEIPKNNKYLERTRDIFCFQCNTSLRYSDLKTLKKADVADGFIEVVTEKTDSYIKIPLSEQAKVLLKKYESTDSEFAFPVPSNQKMNQYIKEICYLAEIDSEVVITYFQGRDRISETFKKYDKISTHTARRTFICLAISENIAPSIIMKISGHKDYRALEAYIDALDSDKLKAVQIFDKL